MQRADLVLAGRLFEDAAVIFSRIWQ